MRPYSLSIREYSRDIQRARLSSFSVSSDATKNIILIFTIFITCFSTQTNFGFVNHYEIARNVMPRSY